MRVGLGLAAAAAAMLCAGQAEAVNFVQYEVSGTGIKYDQALPPPYVSSGGAFTLDFILNLDDPLSSISYGRFSTSNGGFHYYYPVAGPEQVAVDFQLADTTVNFLASLSGSYAISGTAYYGLGDRLQPKFVNATIDKLTVIGPVSAFAAPTYSLPEPQTWAMMIVGVGAIGALVRRRRNPSLATT